MVVREYRLGKYICELSLVEGGVNTFCHDMAFYYGDKIVSLQVYRTDNKTWLRVYDINGVAVVVENDSQNISIRMVGNRERIKRTKSKLEREIGFELVKS